MLSFKKSILLLLLAIISCGAPKLIYEKQALTYAALDYQVPVKTIALETENLKVNLAYIDEGKGDITLIFIHGRGVFLKEFMPQYLYLKQFYRVIAIDLPGYGKSFLSPEQTIKPEQQLKAVFDLIKKLDLKNIILVGHSYGGALAITLSALAEETRKPELKLDILKVIALAPGGLQDYSPQDIQIMKDNFVSMSREVWDADSFIDSWYSSLVYAPGSESDSFLKDMLGLLHSRDYAQTYKTRKEIDLYALNSNNLSKTLHFFKFVPVPVLIIAGKQDEFVPSIFPSTMQKPNPGDFFAEVCSLNSKCTLKMLDQCGHMPNLEKPGEVNALIRSFIEQK
jgi:pimeloyl-ACP methyl ester carboxylesterase